MQHRPISRPQRAQRRGRRQQHARPSIAVGLAIAGHRPSQRPALHDQKALLALPAPSRRRAIAPPASAADAAASCRGPAAHDAARRRSRARECLQRHCPLPTPRETGWRRRGGRRSRGDGRRRTRSPRRERTARSSCASPITLRRQPRNSQTQVIQAGLDQRFFSSVLVAGSWMMPRLPVNRPRCGVAMMSPVGVTRFCRGMRCSIAFHRRHSGMVR